VSYAQNTTVSVEKSKAELEHLLMRYGATSFVSGWQGTRAVIQFEAHGRRIQFELTTPDRDDPAFTHHARGRRTPDAALKAWEQETRRVWRALVLVVKAKLEAVATGITTFEDEFLAHTVIPGPDGRPTTVGRFMRPQVDAAYESGQLPAGILPALPAAGETS
jgi:hypothetical protein